MTAAVKMLYPSLRPSSSSSNSKYSEEIEDEGRGFRRRGARSGWTPTVKIAPDSLPLVGRGVPPEPSVLAAISIGVGTCGSSRTIRPTVIKIFHGTWSTEWMSYSTLKTEQIDSLSSIGWRRGSGRGGKPLSSVLSPLVPRGERKNYGTRTKVGFSCYVEHAVDDRCSENERPSARLSGRGSARAAVPTPLPSRCPCDCLSRPRRGSILENTDPINCPGISRRADPLRRPPESWKGPARLKAVQGLPQAASP